MKRILKRKKYILVIMSILSVIAVICCILVYGTGLLKMISSMASEMKLENMMLSGRYIKESGIMKKDWLIINAAVLFAAACSIALLSMGMVMKEGKRNLKREKLLDRFCQDPYQIALLVDECDLRCRYATPGTCRIFGMDVDEMRGEKVYDLFRNIMSVDENDPEVVSIYGKLTAWDKKEDVFIERFPVVDACSGISRYMRGRVFTPEKGDICILMHDDTDIAAQEKVLYDSLVSARAATQAKSNFLNNMSHDIRTPMNAISGFVSLLEKNGHDPVKVAEYTKKIRVSSDHLLRLINEVLDMSMIESGNTELVMSEFTVGSLLAEILPHIQSQSQVKKQMLTVSGDTDYPYSMIGDKLHICQILINILSNAVKYTPEGGYISVDINVARKTGGKTASVRFAVTDTGIGISDDFADKVFEPFAREDDRDVRKIQGTGLGMAITKNLVELMGGSISIHSRKGAGSCFTVDLEFKLADSKAKSNMYFPYEESGKIKTNEINSVFAGMNILIAEDNDFNAQIMEELLVMAGARCVSARNGLEAAHIFESSVPGSFDLIVMDVMMPVMDGHEATKCIRHCGHPDAQNVFIVAMTANAFTEDVKKSMEAGMDAHVSKPLDMEVLEEIVHKLRTGEPIV